MSSEVATFSEWCQAHHITDQQEDFITMFMMTTSAILYGPDHLRPKLIDRLRKEMSQYHLEIDFIQIDYSIFESVMKKVMMQPFDCVEMLISLHQQGITPELSHRMLFSANTDLAKQYLTQLH